MPKSDYNNDFLKKKRSHKPKDRILDIASDKEILLSRGIFSKQLYQTAALSTALKHSTNVLVQLKEVEKNGGHEGQMKTIKAPFRCHSIWDFLADKTKISNWKAC